MTLPRSVQSTDTVFGLLAKVPAGTSAVIMKFDDTGFVDQVFCDQLLEDVLVEKKCDLKIVNASPLNRIRLSDTVGRLGMYKRVWFENYSFSAAGR